MAGHGVETTASDSKCNEWQRANSCFTIFPISQFLSHNEDFEFP